MQKQKDTVKITLTIEIESMFYSWLMEISKKLRISVEDILLSGLFEHIEAAKEIVRGVYGMRRMKRIAGRIRRHIADYLRALLSITSLSWAYLTGRDESGLVLRERDEE